MVNNHNNGFITTRRSFLVAGLAGFAALSTMNARSETKRGFFLRNQLPLGVQLYVVGDVARTDLDGTLAKIAKIGYRTVELAGFHGHDARTLREAADRARLQFTSIHLTAPPHGTDPGLDGDIGKLCADLRVLGVSRVVMPMFLLPENLTGPAQNESFLDFIVRAAQAVSLDDWKRTAAFLNKKGAELKREGMRLSYHNHNPEFRPEQGTTGFEVLQRETEPDLVSFELDAGWAAAAGVDSIELLKRYPRRFEQMHVKDLLASTRPNYAFQQDPTEVGSGTIRWPALLEAAHAAGVQQFFVEQEPPFSKDRFAAIADSWSYLTGIN